MSLLYWLALTLLTSFAGSEECRFGAGCVFACNCPDNTECNSETGECTGGRGCKEGWSGEGCQVGNVALHKPTSASSTARYRPASHAVDGDYGTLTHVNSDRGRWTVDLRHKFVVTNINITNRLGGVHNHYGARLQHTHIWLHNTSDFMIHTHCSYITQPTVDLSLVSVQCDEPTAARYVTLIKDDGEHEGVPEGYQVDLNNFFEVEVIGYQYQFSPVCDGSWGPGCLIPCNCQAACNTITGRCEGDCVAGWTGENCQQVSPVCDGRWGPGCLIPCNCQAACNTITGRCEGDCAAGWTGENCQQACARGQWGVNCAQPCSQGCHPNDSCDRYTGTCDSCKQYYTGDSCQTEAPQQQSNELKLEEGGVDDNNTAVIAGVAVAVMVVIAVIVAALFFLYIRRRKYSVKKDKESTDLSHISRDLPLKEEKYENLEVKPDIEASVEKEAGTYANLGVGSATAISVEHLHQYVEQRKGNMEAYRDEYQELLRGMQYSAKVGKRPANKNKERFKDMQAYDHSRVVLKGKPEGGYINANYITGYQSANKHYIATIGPRESTTNDFWQMVWQDKVTTIVMLTKLVEARKKKCHPYWPLEGIKQYGDVTVETVSNDEYADYIVTTMTISKQGEDSRMLRHFCFVSWPDHGVPVYATAYLAFYCKIMKSIVTRQKVRGTTVPPTGPLLVHCSAGVGRTGTFIALDILLKQAEHEGVVDVFGCVFKMRQQRVNMVQTVEQYVFLHEALLESLSAENTMVDDNDFITKHQAWSQTGPDQHTRLHNQYQSLEMFRTLVNPDRTATEETNLHKNRNTDIIPPAHMRPYLSTPVKGTNDYINAVYINSFRKSNFFVLTQHPLPSTAADFWRLVHDHACASVISLTPPEDINEDYIAYWPENQGSTSTFGPIKVILESDQPSSAFPEVTVKEIHATNKSKKSRTPHRVKIFQTSGWPAGSATPSSEGMLSPMLALVERWQQSTGDRPVIIQCQDGASRCGVVCSLMYVLEQLKVDHEVDIYTAVKHLLPRRPHLLQPFTQYQYLYTAVLRHLDNYSEYSNFK